MSNNEKAPSNPSDLSLTRRDVLHWSALAGGLLAFGCSQTDSKTSPVLEPDVLSTKEYNSTKKIRLGVVGGNFGATFFFHLHPNCVVTAVSDLLPDRLKKLSEHYHCANTYPSLEAMLSQANDIDAVAIFTPAPEHAKHVLACLKRGLHVFCAVPACLTVDEAGELKSTVKNTGLTYMMGETSYYQMETIFARRAYERGELGKIHYSEVQYYHDFDRKQELLWNPDGTHTWRWGYPPLLYSTHSIALLTAVTRERITKVSALGWGSDSPTLKENVYGSKFSNGAALMLTDKKHICRSNVFWAVPDHGVTASWYGTESALHTAATGVFPRLVNRETLYVHKVMTPEYWRHPYLPAAMRFQTGHNSSHNFLACEFIDALVEDRQPTIDINEALAMTLPGIIADKSAKEEGVQLTVPPIWES